jgi:hypothetical protein
VKPFGRFLYRCAAGFALLLAPVSLAHAELKPLVVVSVAGIDELVGDINYVTKAAGFEGSGKLAEGYIKGFSNGADRKRPSGVIVAPKEGGEFVSISFVPVTDMKAILATLKDSVGAPKDAGDGILELAAGPQTIYIKEVTGWAFVAQQKEHLAELPADPAALLGTLPKDYTLAAKVSVQNLPPDLKKMAAEQIRMGFENNLQNSPDTPGVDKELMAKLNRNAMENFIRMLDELEDITVGFNIDAAGQRTYIDVGMTAIAGSRLAKQIEQSAQTKSSFAAFIVPGAAASLNFAAPVAKEDLEQTRVVMEGIKANVQKELDNDPNLDATRRAAAKELIAGFIDVLQKTLEEGKLDGGAALLLEPKSLNFVAGGLVADGAKVEALFKRLAELAKDEADAPEIKLNSGKHGDVNLHTISGPNDDAKAREILGDKIHIVLGTGPKSIYLAFGKDGEGLLKKMIDQVSQQGPQTVPPSQLNVSLLPILKFAASVDDNPIVPALVSVVEKSGKDKITIVTEIKTRGSNTRILVEEGVLQAIGEGVKQAGLAGGGQPAF